MRLFIFLTWLVVGGVGFIHHTNYLNSKAANEKKRDIYLKQLQSDDTVPEQIRVQFWGDNDQILYLWIGWIGLGLLQLGDFAMKNWKIVVSLFLLSTMSGCGILYKPYQPVELATIAPNEEAFLIPLVGDTTKQVSTSSEEFLAKNLVLTKQIRIPQQWVQLGYQWLFYNGEWKPAGKLLKVDRSPVTREWTADENTGSSNKNQAVWVMTSDQVEFSTGWTITARILTREDAVKFLYNYPNGSLETVLDQEVRGKIQSVFGLEVTDLLMDELRKNATPHITKTIQTVTDFFEKRGITITNLGITGGFVYKNATIMERLVEVFNAEQEKNIKMAKFQAQEMDNKRIFAEAEGKAKALLTEKDAEAKGIKFIADAKAYELQRAKEDLKTYLSLKSLELETKKMEKWNGQFPTYFMGGNTPEMLLQVPTPK